MRITNSMTVNIMEYWLSKQKERLNDAAIVVASGRQINKPSDNPAGSAEILKDRVAISAYGQYESNIEQAQMWIDTSNTTLDAVSSLLSDAQDIITSASSEDDATTAEQYASQLESIYEQVISYANSLYSSTYMYNGNNSTAAAFENNTIISSGTTSNIVFDLADAATTVTIEITDSDGNVVRTLTITGATSGTNALTWNGCDDDGNTLSNGNYSFTVTATDASGNDVASYPSYRGNTGGKEITIGENSTITLNNNGSELFGDAIKALSQAITAFRDTDNNTVSVSDFSTALESAISGIQAQQVTLSNQESQLSNATDRLDLLITSLTGRLSDLLVGSTEEAAVELTTQETVYETTVEAVSSVLNMDTLNDYL